MIRQQLAVAMSWVKSDIMFVEDPQAKSQENGFEGDPLCASLRQRMYCQAVYSTVLGGAVKGVELRE